MGDYMDVGDYMGVGVGVGVPFRRNDNDHNYSIRVGFPHCFHIRIRPP